MVLAGLVFLRLAQGDEFTDPFDQTDPFDDVRPERVSRENVPSDEISKLESRIANQNEELLNDKRRMKADASQKAEIANSDNELHQDAQEMKDENSMINAAADKISELQSENANLYKELEATSPTISNLRARIARQDNKLSNSRQQEQSDASVISRLSSQVSSEQQALQRETQWRISDQNDFKDSVATMRDEQEKLRQKLQENENKSDKENSELTKEAELGDEEKGAVKRYSSSTSVQSSEISELKWQRAIFALLVLILLVLKFKGDITMQAAHLKKKWSTSSSRTDLLQKVCGYVRFTQESVSSWMGSVKLAETVGQVRSWVESKHVYLNQASLVLAEVSGKVRSWMLSKWEIISSWMTSSTIRSKLTEAFESVCQWASSNYKSISRQMARSPPADLKEPLLEEGCPEATHPEDANKEDADQHKKQQDDIEANPIGADMDVTHQEVPEAGLESDSDESAVLVSADDCKVLV
eukprot:gnl/MRDRNA2_/MRDRNA2_31678_c0_seq1.p1 gnl/MRDRNA2_/MRDRNA2_31678_c0~~gnl/MRDRNA2_/MRDRNA2_31678_c0_seq1.p1  ORF type:complete len:507 (+),score=127.00 gnl/MRDRNA2_/MRDRNA2_31678_c0_seq1:108-1523(+)